MKEVDGTQANRSLGQFMPCIAYDRTQVNGKRLSFELSTANISSVLMEKCEKHVVRSNPNSLGNNCQEKRDHIISIFVNFTVISRMTHDKTIFIFHDLHFLEVSTQAAEAEAFILACNSLVANGSINSTLLSTFVPFASIQSHQIRSFSTGCCLGAFIW